MRFSSLIRVRQRGDDSRHLAQLAVVFIGESGVLINW
jgi:hypothetical protein